MSETKVLLDLVQRELDGFCATRKTEFTGISEDLSVLLDYTKELLAGGKRFRALFCYWAWVAALDVSSTQQDSAALDLAELALGHFPKDFGLLDRASVIAEKLGRFELASQLRLRQVNLDPNHPLVRIYYARSLFELGKIEEANFQLAKASQTEEFLSDAGRQYRDLLKDTINQIP